MAKMPTYSIACHVLNNRDGGNPAGRLGRFLHLRRASSSQYMNSTHLSRRGGEKPSETKWTGKTIVSVFLEGKKA